MRRDSKFNSGDKVVAVSPKSKHLTDGKEYEVEWLSIGGYLAVRNDSGRLRPYAADNFKISDNNELKLYNVFGHTSSGRSDIKQIVSNCGANALSSARELYPDFKFNHVNLAKPQPRPVSQ